MACLECCLGLLLPLLLVWLKKLGEEGRLLMETGIQGGSVYIFAPSLVVILSPSSCFPSLLSFLPPLPIFSSPLTLPPFLPPPPSLFVVFPARAPSNITQLTPEQVQMGIEMGEGRNAMTQAGFQLALLGVTLGVSIFGGLFTGT